ncbi:MAG: hypothetical protein ACI95C_002590 [Pseudohongiellaceae bacterium]|jgi:hypothetical protein
MHLLQIAELLLSLYGVNAVLTSKIYAKSGMKGRYVYKDKEPVSFWVVCASSIGVGMLIYFATGNLG